ncbi:glycosyltransferase family 87 protein [Mucilaginibacter sp.]|uniref:glycosyltransferase family 87 protein n=1 Tax=Mucilaginibacter sp. TaxID=1882438 RepID=UPI0035BC1C11
MILFLWFGLSLFVVLKGIITHQTFNNFTIFRYNFLNTIHQHNLYAPQPQHYDDLNHYGPAFSLLIAPFALLPESLGVLLWVFFNAFILYKAVRSLPFKKDVYLPVLLICAHELMTASANVQSNAMIAAFILLSFSLIKKQRDFWAALLIALGTLIKLYGIVGLAFFLFSDNKLKLLAGLAFWSVLLFFLPMAISSPAFIVQTYHDWYIDLVAKNNVNQSSFLQDISVMGMIRTVFHVEGLKNIYIISPALLLFILSYSRVKYFNSLQYQLLMLSSVLIFTVIFSSSAESSTYIIAFAGVAIWFMNLNRPISILEIGLLVFAIIVTSFSPSDLFPRSVRMEYIVPYKLKSLPCLLIWLKILHEILTRDFDVQKVNDPNHNIHNLESNTV